MYIMWNRMVHYDIYYNIYHVWERKKYMWYSFKDSLYERERDIKKRYNKNMKILLSALRAFSERLSWDSPQSKIQQGGHLLVIS